MTIMMSDSLKDQIDLEQEEMINKYQDKFVTVNLFFDVDVNMTGLLKTIMHGEKDLELEIKTILTDALRVVIRKPNELLCIVLTLFQDDTVIKGPFLVKAIRIDNIEAVEQLCDLSMQLLKQ
jgi:hypothetical protein